MHGPHELEEGRHGVWAMDAADAPWERVHDAVVYGREIPVDFAGASRDFIILQRDSRLLRYDFDSGVRKEITGLYADDLTLSALYSRFDLFPLFRLDEVPKIIKGYPVYRERLEPSKNTFKGKIVYKSGPVPHLSEAATRRLTVESPPASYSYSGEKDDIKKNIKAMEKKFQVKGKGQYRYRNKLGREVNFLTSVIEKLSAEETGEVGP
ncbi:unnamed protein product [Urochloa humidicola]